MAENPDVIEMMGVPMHTWTLGRTLHEITHRVEAGDFTQHTVVNVAKLVNVQRDAELAKAVIASDIINIDGMGVVWGARVLGHHVPERVAGIDLFSALLELAEQKGWSVYFLGARDDVLSRCVNNLQAQFPGLRIAGRHHGYFWDYEEKLVDEIAATKADLLFVAITSPKKEQFIDRWNTRLGVRFVMGVGGTFDVMAGDVRRAPRALQALGLEWLFRTAQEPRRMWRRYLSTNSRFAWMLLKERARR